MPGRRSVALALSAVFAIGACTSGGAAPSASAPAASVVSVASPVPTPRLSRPETAAPSASPAAAHLYDPNADARADIAATLAAAKASGKRVLIDFGADWCPDCHALDAHLHSPAGTALIDASFEVVHVDVGYWDHNLDVAAAYGNPIALGIPAVVVIEADGSLVGSSADGSLASAGGMSERQVIGYLAAFAGG